MLVNTEAKLPDPHPLDFDWRFDEATASSIASMLIAHQPIVALGTPTIARRLKSYFVDVTLVDRQPFQQIEGQEVCDIGFYRSRRQFMAAIADPPWYPEDLLSWAEIAAELVGIGGKVYTCVWPPDVRPFAREELANVLRCMSEWSDVNRSLLQVRYSVPRFEEVASVVGKGAQLSTSPRAGELIRLDITKKVVRGIQKQRENNWIRFTINDYQLAIRASKDEGANYLMQHPKAVGWQWPYVSARASGRDLIDVWSSEGEVACIGSSIELVILVRTALTSRSIERFEGVLAQIPQLLQWRIPRPPYWRLSEWHQ